MAKDKPMDHLTIDYHTLGTISHRELIDALIDDLYLVNNKYRIRFYRDAKLILWGSNEFGDPLHFRVGSGGRVKRLDSSHHRPACLDYDL